MYSVDTALTIEFGSFPRLAIYRATLPGVAGQGQLLRGSLLENSRVLSGRDIVKSYVHHAVTKLCKSQDWVR